MPLNKMEPIYPSISLKAWKIDETKTIKFLSDGEDRDTQNGRMVVFAVREGTNKELKSLWIKPASALHIGVNNLLPLANKTLRITKTFVEGKDANKGIRYNAVVI